MVPIFRQLGTLGTSTAFALGMRAGDRRGDEAAASLAFLYARSCCSSWRRLSGTRHAPLLGWECIMAAGGGGIAERLLPAVARASLDLRR